MAIPTGAIWEVRASGPSDTFGGFFNPQNTNFATNLTATSGNTSSPVVSSATYTFVAGDVGHWLFIKSGTNWTPGWYQIASVSAGAATLTAGANTAILLNGVHTGTRNTTAGCATVASPTGGTWGIDYSQANSARYAYTDLTVGGTTTQVTSAANPFGPNCVGNGINLVSGAGITTGIVEVVSVSGTTATLDRSAGTAASVATANLGGALLTPGYCASQFVGGNFMWLTGSFSITAATANIAGGCLSLATHGSVQTQIRGYTSYRGDGGDATLTASGISTFTMLTITSGSFFLGRNIVLNGASLTSSRAMSGNSSVRMVNCEFKNLTNGALTGGECWSCVVTGCGTTSPFGFSAAVNTFFCEFYANTITPALGGTHSGSISHANTGASTDGFSANFGSIRLIDCVAYNNGRHGIHLQGGGVAAYVYNCVCVNNAGWGITTTLTNDTLATCRNNATYNNASGGINTNILDAFGPFNNNVTLTGDPFVNAGSGNFSPNATAGAGLALRAAAYATYRRGLTTSYEDVGIQHQDSGGGGSGSTFMSRGLQTGGRM